MRHLIAMTAAGLACVQIAAGQSRIVYTLELGGDNHADLWEANQAPGFTQGVTDGVVRVAAGKDLTWGVRVSAGGVHIGQAGDGLVPYGAANLVFDLELYDHAGNLVPGFGAAPLALVGDQNVPTDMGFWSSINDGDSASTRGSFGPDLLANAAFAISIHNQDPVAPPPAQLYSLIDPAPYGPNFDYGWYPTANYRGGTDLDGTKPINTSVSGLDGMLVGFGAGYRSYDYTNYRPGVGIAYLTDAADYGFGAFVDRVNAPDPLAPPAGVKERVLFEGQICTKNLPLGTYTLKVWPSPDGNNILHGDVVWDSPTPDYGGFGSFAAHANEVYPNDINNPGMQFEVVPATILARHVFYNQSYYDGNKVAIDPAPLAGANNDDGDAIDPSKSPLLPGGGMATFPNWTGYDKGINGLIYDVAFPTRGPVPDDFTFLDIGKAGTAAGTVKTPSGFRVIAGGGDAGSDRVIITFANGSMKNTWLQVTVGTGFGLPIEDVHYWGNVVGDCGFANPAPFITVNAADELDIRSHKPPPILPTWPRVPVDYEWDINKDSLCNATDELIARFNATTIFNCVRMITR